MEQNREKTHFGHNMRALAEWRSTISMHFFFVVSPSLKLKLIHQYICINTIYARKNNCKIFFHSSCARLLSLHIVVGRFYYLAFLICFFFFIHCAMSRRGATCVQSIFMVDLAVATVIMQQDWWIFKEWMEWSVTYNSNTSNTHVCNTKMFAFLVRHTEEEQTTT